MAERSLFVDLKYLPPHTRMAGGRHYVDVPTKRHGPESCSAYPCGRVCQASTVLSPPVCGGDSGIDPPWCMFAPYGPLDFDRPTSVTDIETLLRTLGVGWAGRPDLVVVSGRRTTVPIPAAYGANVCLVPRLCSGAQQVAHP